MYVSQAYPELGKGLVTMAALKSGEKQDGLAQVLDTDSSPGMSPCCFCLLQRNSCALMALGQLAPEQREKCQCGLGVQSLCSYAWPINPPHPTLLPILPVL